MAKLTAKRRNKLPAAEFAGPDRSYPIPDRAHAANAKARATQQENAGHLSPAQADRIRAKADKKLGRSTRIERAVNEAKQRMRGTIG